MSPVPLVAVTIALAAIPPAILARSVWQQREEPGAKPFIAGLFAYIAFDLLYLVSMFVGHEAARRVIFVLLALLVLLSSVAWLLFVLEYTGRVSFVTRQLVAGLVGLPTMAVLFILSPIADDYFFEEYAVVRTAGVLVTRVEFGPFGAALMGMGFGALLIALVMLLAFVITRPRRFGLQAGVLAIAGTLPGVTTLLRTHELTPVAHLNLTPFAWAVGSLLVLGALRRWDLFGFAPATLRVGQAAAFDDLGEAVIIVDDHFRVVDLNTHAAALFDRPPEALVQQSIESLLGSESSLGADDSTVQLETDRGHREFDVSVSSIEGSWSGTIGHTLVLHDVTTEKQRRQRFEVLNRILRHNLRNSMNAVVGYSQELGTHVNGSAEWMVERIEDQTTKLVELSEKAREIDRVTTPTDSPTSVSVATSLGQASERLCEDYPELTATVDAPDDLAATTNEVVFEEVLRYAAASLVRYNDVSEPEIEFAAAATTDERGWLSIAITTNGDPIPDDEREVIERGEETPLDHSHDLDLWLVSWGIDTLGGELEFIVDDEWPGIALSIPDLQDAGGPARSEVSGDESTESDDESTESDDESTESGADTREQAPPTG